MAVELNNRDMYCHEDDINVICELLAVKHGDLELDLFSNLAVKHGDLELDLFSNLASDAFIEFSCTRPSL